WRSCARSAWVYPKPTKLRLGVIQHSKQPPFKLGVIEFRAEMQALVKREVFMLKTAFGALLLVALLTLSLAAQDANTVIANASKAMGADNLKSIQYSGSGYDFAIGQNVNPNSPWSKFIDKTYTRVVNFETLGFQMDRIRMQGENPPRGGGQQPVVD